MESGYRRREEGDIEEGVKERERGKHTNTKRRCEQCSHVPPTLEPSSIRLTIGVHGGESKQIQSSYPQIVHL